jgi:hypothetical protein
MSETVPIDELADAIMRNLQEYTDDVTAGIKKAEDVTAQECKENLEADSPVGATGKYKKGWKVTVTKDTPSEKHTVIHNKEYRLTHLLEYGHATRNGGRTKAEPHIKKNEEKANAAFEKRVEEVIRNGH